MELHSARGLRSDSIASNLCKRYLDRLPLTAEARHALDAHIDIDTGDAAPRDAMTRVHRALAGRQENGNDPAYASVAHRLQCAYDRRSAQPHPPGNQSGNVYKLLERRRQTRLQLAPAPRRASMVPHPWGPLNPLKRWWQSQMRRRHHWVERKEGEESRPPWPANVPPAGQEETIDSANPTDSPDPRGRWQHLGNIRRVVLLALMLAQTVCATWFMSKVLPYQGKTAGEIAVLVLFSILFCWVSAGFWTAMTGFLVLLRGSDRYGISREIDESTPIAADARTAIVMPICNEDVARVMAGLRATYESVARSGELERFDFFILSDSSDSDICTAELSAWANLCRAVDGFGRIFYRRRQRRVKRKSGNIDDFCRRWGKNYRYMIVLDADSVMSGAGITRLVRMMEANPGAGIIQTAPIAAGRDTLYARIQQFSTRVYGPLFTAGLHYWQLGESHYWGHNAIIRVAPFMRHCALSPLPGRGSLAGEILSHDFVEAALMRRAGWAVWIAYDLDGSYEEMPPNLLDELKRDRRWCHGNLMNFRLFAARGMHPVHRAVFVTGVMAYLSAPLWALFLALSTGLLAWHTLIEPQYFVEPRQLFPIWPQWHPEKAIALFSATATLLFLPKILSVLLICARGAQRFGGVLRVTAGMLAELLFSMLLAPVRMLFHAWFVLAAFLGWKIHWKSPPREDSETAWREAVSKHGAHTLLGFAWGAAVYWLNPSFLPWLLPIAGALALSIPLSVLSSRVSPGRLLRRAGLFVIPEEAQPPLELRATFAHDSATHNQPDFVDAVIDPVVNALVCAAGKPRKRLPAHSRALRAQLMRHALLSGPDALTHAQKNILLTDPLLLSRLHFEAWTAGHAHATWRAAIRRDTGVRPVAARSPDLAARNVPSRP